MKKLGIVGFVIGVGSLGLAMYNQFIVLPKVNSLFESTGGAIWRYAREQMMLQGNIAAIAGAVGLILCLLSIFRGKSRIGIIGAILALIGGILGLMQSMAG